MRKNARPPDELAAFEQFCLSLKLENGRPMRLYPEERWMLWDYFEGAIETLILIPKKNGKTTLMAALALFHLVTTPDAACYIAAASRDQATIMYRQASGFIRRSPWLSKYVEIKKGTRELRSINDDGFLLVLAADADTVDGVIPTLALVDELHRHKSSNLYAVLRDGLGPRPGRMLTISTAGDTEESPLGRIRAAAHALPNQFVRGVYRYAKSKSLVLHEWALSSDADRSDLSLVKQANPAPWQTIKSLKSRLDSPSMMTWEWARFACGVWVTGENGVIAEQEWRECEVFGCEIPADADEVVVGIDLGWKWDTTALVPCWQDEDGDIWVSDPTIVEPPRDGTSTPTHVIEGVLLEFADRWGYGESNIAVIDPRAGGEQLAEWISETLGWRVITYSQQPGPMAQAAQRLHSKIRARKFHHPGDPDYTSQMLAAASKPVGESWRFVKPKQEGVYVDSAIGTSMAVSHIVGETDSSSVYESRGVLILD